MLVLKKIPPRVKYGLAAFLLTVGLCGTIHLVSSLVIAIYRHRLSELNPYYIIGVNNALGRLGHNPYIEIFGWCCWLVVIYVIYRGLKAAAKSGGAGAPKRS